MPDEDWFRGIFTPDEISELNSIEDKVDDENNRMVIIAIPLWGVNNMIEQFGTGKRFHPTTACMFARQFTLMLEAHIADGEP